MKTVTGTTVANTSNILDYKAFAAEESGGMTMANEVRLIDANAVDYENIMCSQSQLHWLNAIIEQQPTIDPETLRPKGRWITDDKGVTYCGRCRHIDDYASVHNYCPNCGAKMEG